MKKTGKAAVRTLLQRLHPARGVFDTGGVWAQVPNAADYDKKYTLAGLTVLGADYTDAQAVKLFSALQIGQELTIPGEEITRAILQSLAQNLFEDISIELGREVRDSDVYLVIRVEEIAPPDAVHTLEGVVTDPSEEALRGQNRACSPDVW